MFLAISAEPCIGIEDIGGLATASRHSIAPAWNDDTMRACSTPAAKGYEVTFAASDLTASVSWRVVALQSQVARKTQSKMLNANSAGRS